MKIILDNATAVKQLGSARPMGASWSMPTPESLSAS